LTVRLRCYATPTHRRLIQLLRSIVLRCRSMRPLYGCRQLVQLIGLIVLRCRSMLQLDRRIHHPMELLRLSIAIPSYCDQHDRWCQTSVAEPLLSSSRCSNTLIQSYLGPQSPTSNNATTTQQPSVSIFQLSCPMVPSMMIKMIIPSFE